MEYWLSLIRNNKKQILEEYVAGLLNRFPETYSGARGELLVQGEIYFDFLLDLNVPVEQHSIMGITQKWVTTLAVRHIPFVHSLYSFHLFRNAMMDVTSRHYPDEPFPYPIFRKISDRMDTFERYMTGSYSDISLTQLREKDRQIVELHDDRMNIVGKMAASFAHELRNPLTAIGGFLKLIRTQLPSEALLKVENYLDYIQIEFDNFQMQITGFLSFSKRRMMEEEFSSVTAQQLIDHVLTMNMPHVLNENIQFDVDIQSDIPLQIQRVGMQQVLSNLIHNGIDALTGVDYEKRMSIRVQEKDRHVQLSVSNNGPQIPVQIRETIFSPFVTGKKDGTGLGLAICKQIVEKNNGEISFTTKEGETRFILTLPRLMQGKETGLVESGEQKLLEGVL